MGSVLLPWVLLPSVLGPLALESLTLTLSLTLALALGGPDLRLERCDE